MSLTFFDWMFFFSAVSFFSIIIGVFIGMKKEMIDFVRRIGLGIIILIFPVFFVFINYIVLGKELWIILFIIFILVYLIIETILDFVLHSDFRDNWKTHVPYILLEYAACFGFLFVTISIDAILGWIVAVFFWAFFGALIYLYAGKKQSKKEGD